MHNYIAVWCERPPKGIRFCTRDARSAPDVTALPVLDLPKPTVSRHLALLRQRLWLHVRAKSVRRWSTACPTRIVDGLDRCATSSRVAEQQAGRLENLNGERDARRPKKPMRDSVHLVVGLIATALIVIRAGGAGPTAGLDRYRRSVGRRPGGQARPSTAALIEARMKGPRGDADLPQCHEDAAAEVMRTITGLEGAAVRSIGATSQSRPAR